MAQDNNPLFHLEPVAVAALNKKYSGTGPLPDEIPSYSIAISLKRIADRLEKGVVQS